MCEKCVELKKRVQFLEEVLFQRDWIPTQWSLLPVERLILTMLVSVPTLETERLIESLKYNGYNGTGVASQIYRMRRKLTAHGIVINSSHGRYWIDENARKLLVRLRDVRLSQETKAA